MAIKFFLKINNPKRAIWQVEDKTIGRVGLIIGDPMKRASYARAYGPYKPYNVGGKGLIFIYRHSYFMVRIRIFVSLSNVLNLYSMSTSWSFRIFVEAGN